MELGLDGHGLMWLHHRAELGGEELGRSGVWRTWAARAAAQARRAAARAHRAPPPTQTHSDR